MIYSEKSSALEIMKDMCDSFNEMTKEYQEVQAIKEPLENGLYKLNEWDKIFKDTSNKIEENYTDRLNEVSSQLDNMLICNLRDFPRLEGE